MSLQVRPTTLVRILSDDNKLDAVAPTLVDRYVRMINAAHSLGTVVSVKTTALRLLAVSQHMGGVRANPFPRLLCLLPRLRRLRLRRAAHQLYCHLRHRQRQ